MDLPDVGWFRNKGALAAMSNLLLLLAVAVAAALLPRSTAAAPVVIATIPVGDQPYWLGANPTTNRVYVANFQSDNVSVIDGATYTEIDTDGNPANGVTRIPVGAGPLAAGANPSTDRIYVANIDGGNVSVIDGATYTEIDTDGNPANGVTPIPVGAGPVGVAVNPTTNRIYVANWWSDNVSVIDGDSDAVETTVTVGVYPFGVAVNPTTNRIYVGNSGTNNVSVIDGDQKIVVATVTVGDGPNGVVANPTIDRIYTANYDSDTVSVVQGVGPAVGGIAELPDVAGPSGTSGMGSATYAVLAGAAAGVLAFAVLATLSVRRWRIG